MVDFLKALGVMGLLLSAGYGIAAYAQDAELVPGTRVEVYVQEHVLNSSSSVSSVSSQSSSSSSSSTESLPIEPIEPDPLALTGTKAILIFLKMQQAYLTVNGDVVKTYRISSGAPQTPTPKGTFKIYHKQELRVSSATIPYRMPHYMAFTSNGAFGLHGLPYLGRYPEGSIYWREAETHIGTPVSHGCIRFLPEEAEEIYGWVDIGTPVIIQS